MASCEKITERVFRVGGSGLSESADCLVYVIDLGEPVLIDCGAGRSWPHIRDNIVACGLDPASLHSLILTHGHVDHIGAAAQIRSETGCKVIAHEKDKRAIESGDSSFTVSNLYGIELTPFELDEIVSDEQVDLEFSAGSLRLIHTPGHTPGSLSVLYEDGAQKVLFGQDIHGPFSPAFESDLDAWRASMRKLIEIGADVLCEGHFGVFRPASEVRRFIEGQLNSSKVMMPVPVPL